MAGASSDADHRKLPHFVAEDPIYYPPGDAPYGYGPYPEHPPPPPPRTPYYSTYSPAPPPPKYHDYKEKCVTKEWSTPTELCKPELDRNCERLRLRTKKITVPKSECSPSMIPKCKIDQSVKKLRLCNSKVVKKRVALHATLYEQVMVTRCNTHYETKCRRDYGYKTRCYSVPVQVRLKSSSNTSPVFG